MIARLLVVMVPGGVRPPLVSRRGVTLAMSAVIVIEIVLGLIVLAGAVMFAVRDTRQRSAAAGEDYSEPEHTAEVPERSSEQQVEQPVSEVADRV